MRTYSNYLFLTLLVVIALSGCATLAKKAEAPYVTLSDLQLLKMSLFEQRYRLTLRLQNPNDFQLPIKGLSFKVNLNDKHFAQGVSNQAVTIPANGEGFLDVDVSSGISQLFKQIKGLGKTGIAGVKYAIEGKVKISGLHVSIPFETSGQL